ncbi:uncharacterized protein LOC114916488 [Cajanus cajan]|uniref:uncharacterized protein LOC114916488 n=1 Tax=Cajanus cajan TaxID=3821 RepID=UPI0010FB4891|nr:uncharacterized protein LOC114916488 [Cajanus cajan]
MDVNLDRILIPVILCIVGISLHNSTSSTSFLVFFVINTIIFVILVGSRKPYLAEVDMALPLFPSFSEVRGETQGDILEDATDEKVDESDDVYSKFLGDIKDESVDNVDDKALPLLPSFFEVRGEAQGGFLENAIDDKVDESDDGAHSKDESEDNVDEIIRQEQEESDDNLKTRIESFIAKVYNGWIEESHWDKYGIDI